MILALATARGSTSRATTVARSYWQVAVGVTAAEARVRRADAAAADYRGTNLNPVGVVGGRTNCTGAVEYLPMTWTPSEASA